MRKHQLVALAILVACIALASLPLAAKDKGDAGRLLTGRVVDKQEAPSPTRWFTWRTLARGQ